MYELSYAILRSKFGKSRGSIHFHLVSISVPGEDIVITRCEDILSDLDDKVVKAVNDLDRDSPLDELSKNSLHAMEKFCKKVCHGQEIFDKFKN